MQYTEYITNIVTSMKINRQIDIIKARHKGETKKLLELAHLEQEDGNHELAEALYHEVKLIEKMKKTV